MLLGSPPDMIRGHPLRKTGSAASHGGLSTELFYYKSGRLATGKKKMWRVSQKIHRGSLAFFGKWDKINRIRGMPQPKKCAAQRNPPVTASPCQPPFRQGSLGGRIATTSLRTGLAMTWFFTGGAGQGRFGRTEASAPTDSLIAGEGGTM